MRLLKEEARARSAADEQLADLVRAAEPYRPNPFRKRLVLLRVERALESRGSHFVFRSAVASALLLGGTATAVGAIGYRLLHPSEPPAAAPALGAPPAATPLEAAPAAPPLEAPVEPEPEEQVEAAKPAEPAPVRAQRTAPRAESPRRASVEGEDPSKVLEAVRALRKEGDATRAQALLDDYLTSQPKGALTEDALALAIEAAAARRDPRAADYARRYLQRFPNGRFKAVAERAAGRR